MSKLCHKKPWRGQAGVTLVSVLVSLGVIAATALVYATASDSFKQASQENNRRLDFVAFEDSVRHTLGNYVTVALGKGTIRCATVWQDVASYYQRSNPALAEPPGGYMLTYYVKPAGQTNDRSCTAALQTQYSHAGQYYFCLKVESDVDRARGAHSSRIDAGVVEVRLQPMNMLDGSMLTCAAYQAATAAPTTGVHPGTRIFYRATWQGFSDKEAHKMRRSGVIYATSVPNET